MARTACAPPAPHAQHATLHDLAGDPSAAVAARPLRVARPYEVLASKLAIPAVRHGSVTRIGLVNRLRSERSLRLATVVAPAGYGKTTLLAQWAERDERPFAWVTVDERDNDPLVLLRHVAAALDRVEPCDPCLVTSLSRPDSSVWTSAAPLLATSFASCPVPVVVVLDDVDRIRAGAAADVVAALAEHVPDQSMLVLAGRTQPPLPIARLRASGRLLELGTHDLALAPRESEMVLRGAGLQLDDDVAADLAARSEGWAAGLYLAGRARGAEPYVSDYLDAEVVARLAPERVAFLRRTSILDRLSGPLCDAVLGCTESAAELNALAHENLFVVGLDGPGAPYRHHRLVREALLQQLQALEPELAATLHRRAADWFEAHGDPASAVDHAQSSGDVERAARLVAEAAQSVYDAGGLDRLEGWLGRLPADSRGELDPAVVVRSGWCHAVRGRAQEARWCLQTAQRAVAGGPISDQAAVVRVGVALLRGAACADGIESMRRDADTALAELPPDSPWRATAMLLQAVAADLLGETALADATFAAAADEADRLGATVALTVALAERSLLAAEAGDHSAASELALAARALVTGGGTAGYATSAIVRAASARVFLRQGRLDDARRELAAAARVAPSLTHALPWLSVRTRLALAGVHVSLRDRPGACGQLTEAEAVLGHCPHLGNLAERVAALREQIAAMPEPRADHGAGLTPAELRLLPLLATHLSFREIGERLFVSRNTVKTQAISVYRKLGASSRSEAIERAFELGLVDDAGAGTTGFVHTG